MKSKITVCLSTLLFVFAAVPSLAQAPRGAGFGASKSQQFSGANARLFGENPNFSADVEMETKSGSEEPMTIPGKIAFSEGKSRFELSTSEIRGSNARGANADQIKSMGMDKMIIISRPDKKVQDMVYPGMQAYVETPLSEKESREAAASKDFKVETTPLGHETVDGHDCAKNKTVVIDNDGGRHEATVWNATDLHNFPVKIQQTENGNLVTMHFKNVKLVKPEDSQFSPSSDLTKYDSMQAMFQQQMMKRFGAGGGFPGRKVPQ